MDNDKYSDYYNFFWDKVPRTQAEQDLYDRFEALNARKARNSEERAQQEAEQRKIQEVQAQRDHHHRPRPAPGHKPASPKKPPPGRKPISPKTSAERQAALNRSNIRKSPPPPPVAGPSHAGRDPKQQEWAEGLKKLKALKESFDNGIAQRSGGDPETLRAFLDFTRGREGPTRGNGRARIDPLKSLKKKFTSSRDRRPATPPAPAGRAHDRRPTTSNDPTARPIRSPPMRPSGPEYSHGHVIARPSTQPGGGYIQAGGINFINEHHIEDGSSSDSVYDEDEDENRVVPAPPPNSARSPLYNNAPRPDRYQAQVQQYDDDDDDSEVSSGFDDAILEAIATAKRDIVRKKQIAGGRARIDPRARSAYPPPEFPGDALYEFEDDFGNRTGIRRTGGRRDGSGTGQFGRNDLERSDATRQQGNSGAFGTPGRTTLQRSDRVQPRQGGTTDAGPSMRNRPNRVQPRQGGRNQAPGIRNRPARVSPRPGGNQGTAGDSGIRNRPDRVTPRPGGTMGGNELQRSNAGRRRPDESTEEWAKRTIASFGSRIDNEGVRHSQRTFDLSPEGSPKKKSPRK